MNKLPLIAIVALALAAPAVARAASPPVGDTICEAGVCMTLEAGDEWTHWGAMQLNATPTSPRGPVRTAAGIVSWDWSPCTSVNYPWGPFVPGACTMISCSMESWLVERSNPYRRNDPYLTAYVRRCYENGTSLVIMPKYPDSVEYDARYDSPDCNPTGENESYLMIYPGLDGVGVIANPDTAPPGFREACHLPTTEEAAARVAYLRRIQETRDYGAAGVDRRCTSIGAGGHSVAVTTDGVICTPAHDVLARYLRGGGTSRGFRCARFLRAASCKRVSSYSVRRVVGRWG